MKMGVKLWSQDGIRGQDIGGSMFSVVNLGSLVKGWVAGQVGKTKEETARGAGFIETRVGCGHPNGT